MIIEILIIQKPNVLARIEKAMIGINQQKKVMMKQRLTSSVSIFLISPYLTIRIIPRAAIPTTTRDHPRISHLKKSDKQDLYIIGIMEYLDNGIMGKTGTRK
jgi:hypothetical protein